MGLTPIEGFFEMEILLGIEFLFDIDFLLGEDG